MSSPEQPTPAPFDPVTAPTSAAGPQYEAPQVEAQLRKVLDLIDAARPMPLSSSSIINKEEVLELLNGALAQLPDELRAARWLLKEREEFLARVRREGDDILELGRARAERMVQRTEVVKAAEARARQIVEAAEAEARRVRLEAEDYCDQKLGSFEIVLEKTLQVVQTGRVKLQGNPLHQITSEPSRGAEGMPDAGAADRPGGFFDQDDAKP